MRKIWDIPGGIHPPENKQQSLSEPLAEALLPARVVLPLNMHIGVPAESIVRVGDRVKTGQMVAKPTGAFSAAVHASISGVVTAIEDHPIPHASGLEAPCILIESDGKDDTVEFIGTPDYRSLQPAEIVDKLRDAGLIGMGGAGFPTSIKLSPKNKVDTLILNGTECEPYITSDNCLMREYAPEIIKGIELLSYALGEPESILIGVEDNKPDAIQALQTAAEASSNKRIEIISFPTKYPSGGEKQLIQILTGKEVPSGGLPSDQGIVLQNVGTAVAAWEGIVEGRPIISRITTLVGEALGRQCNLKVRIGTPVADVLAQVDYRADKADRIVMGGPMMGFSVLDDQVPVTKITNCLLVPTSAELPKPPPAQPCIRCGLCAEACPASLLPQQLLWYAQSHDHEKLQDYNLFDCIECGACAYVCPSSIPLVQYYRASKGDIRLENIEKEHADQARERFEARKVRLEQEAAAREEKRKVRMEAAKAKQAKSPENDLVAKAMARVASTKEDPAEAKAKLERQKKTFVERIQGMNAKADAAPSDEQKSKFLAQIKNTKKKLSDIESRLAELEQEGTPTSDEAEAEKSVEPKVLDAAAIAIAKAKERAEHMGNMSDKDKLIASIDSLNARLAKAEQKLLAAAEKSGDESNDLIEALRTGRDKLAVKLADAKNELEKLEGRDADA